MPTLNIKNCRMYRSWPLSTGIYLLLLSCALSLSVAFAFFLLLFFNLSLWVCPSAFLFVVSFSFCILFYVAFGPSTCKRLNYFFQIACVPLVQANHLYKIKTFWLLINLIILCYISFWVLTILHLIIFIYIF